MGGMAPEWKVFFQNGWVGTLSSVGVGPVKGVLVFDFQLIMYFWFFSGIVFG